MSIANELSSEVAAAVMARRPDEPARSPDDLAGVVKDVYTTLRELEAAATRRRRTRLGRPAKPAEAKAAGVSE
ncbi:MAG TPA: hypothetical protein VEY09_03830 [Pyrinomonadaceae bacterium]|nr:hypothetical protein [Pyrinomonadaceae bacterium]